MRKVRVELSVVVCTAVGCLLPPRVALANGHGPVYGLATPTLGQGSWSLDVGGMERLVGRDSQVSARPMLSYGITPDLQLSASVPLPLYGTQGVDAVRMMALMPGTSDVELLLGWRFHRQEPSLGARFESTAYLGLDYPTEAFQPGEPTAPGLTGAAVTGYASRSVYAWAGVLYHRAMTPVGADHPGDQAMATLVLGYRPPFLRRDEPHPDWRLFIEGVGEYVWPDEVAGQLLPNTGGVRVFVGPTVLGIFGAWAVSGGPLFPVYSSLDGSQPADALRLAVIFSHWWF